VVGFVVAELHQRVGPSADWDIGLQPQHIAEAAVDWEDSGTAQSLEALLEAAVTVEAAAVGSVGADFAIDRAACSEWPLEPRAWLVPDAADIVQAM
jgi:hypothetical protein